MMFIQVNMLCKFNFSKPPIFFSVLFPIRFQFTFKISICYRHLQALGHKSGIGRSTNNFYVYLFSRYHPMSTYEELQLLKRLCTTKNMGIDMGHTAQRLHRKLAVRKVGYLLLLVSVIAKR